MNGVIIAQLTVARAQNITGRYLMGVVPVALSSGQLMDGQHTLILLLKVIMNKSFYAPELFDA